MDGNPPISGIKGVVFDLDGTLYTAKFLGLTIATGLLGELALLRKLFVVRNCERHKTYPNLSAFKAGFAETFSKIAKIPPDRALDWYESRFMSRFTFAIAKRGKRRSGVVALLEHLKTNGIRLAVVSDFGAVPARLEAIGISPKLFDIALGAEAFGVMKPSGKPFLSIAESWQIPIENILLIGDREDHDQKSATLAGAKFVGISGTKNAGPDFLPWDKVVKTIENACDS
jgi:FMN phosphatase YigB (HAD superfamily)